MQWLLIIALAADLAGVRNEPNLERRSDLALDNANMALTAARAAYMAGDLNQTKANFDEVQDSVELAYKSLEETGKSPRRNPKFFKRAEMSTRQLLRRLDGMLDSMSVDDRGLIERVRLRVSEIHDNLLTGLMEKKPK